MNELFHSGPLRRLVASASSAAAHGSFRVLQLNTLAHWTVDDESPEDFSRRMELHEQHIRHHDPDIVVLEEIDGPKTLPADQPSLPARLTTGGPNVSYDGVFGSKHISGDETWLLFRKSRFQLGHHEVLRMGTEDEQQFAIAALLSEKVGEGGAADLMSPILVVGLHAKAGRTDANEETRIRHSNTLAESLRAHASFQQALLQGRCIVMGDFNAGPHDYDGKYPAQWYPTCVTADGGALRGLGLISAYAEARLFPGEKLQEPPFTTFKHRKGALISQCIDYIFYTPAGMSCSGVLPMPLPEAIPAETALPAPGLWGSDHLSLVCDFTLNNK